MTAPTAVHNNPPTNIDAGGDAGSPATSTWYNMAKGSASGAGMFVWRWGTTTWVPYESYIDGTYGGVRWGTDVNRNSFDLVHVMGGFLDDLSSADSAGAVAGSRYSTGNLSIGSLISHPNGAVVLADVASAASNNWEFANITLDSGGEDGLAIMYVIAQNYSGVAGWTGLDSGVGPTPTLIASGSGAASRGWYIYEREMNGADAFGFRMDNNYDQSIIASLWTPGAASSRRNQQSIVIA